MKHFDKLMLEHADNVLALALLTICLGVIL